ncbi:MAG TPA: biotin/lipoyl-binding protein, partial [Guyparkeria sp.]|nr:biotin/lipoyl-binding protein [Guyparkeria sp.]
MVSHSKTRLAILLLILLAAGAVLAWQLTREPPATDHLTLYGNIDLRQVQIAFDQSARIETLTVQAGDRVEQGELLGTLDPRRFRADLAAAQAELDTRQAALDRLLAGTRPQEIERLRGVVAADEATLEGAR